MTGCRPSPLHFEGREVYADAVWKDPHAGQSFVLRVKSSLTLGRKSSENHL